MTQPAPFTISIPQEKLDDIRNRVEAYQFYPAPDDDQWQYGMNTEYLRSFRKYWLNDFDWRKIEDTLNLRPHFKARVEDFDIHYIHIVGEAKGKRPLLMTHGWPGSFFEFWEVMGPLAYPSYFDGKPEDAFDLIIPSLPGYGFSSKPTKPIGQKTTARLFDKLMRETLGYDTYLAQGGDWGSVVTSWIGFNHSIAKGGGCKSIHLNMMGISPNSTKPETEEEKNWLAITRKTMSAESSYMQQQITKPQTLALALMDSPMGQAAWILEKFQRWADLDLSDPPDIAFTKEQLLTNLMIYLVNDAFATSVWYYNGQSQERANRFPNGERVEIPVGFASYPGEFIKEPPRSWMEKVYNIQHWQDMPKGGHFAAMEQPLLFAKNIQSWGQTL